MLKYRVCGSGPITLLLKHILVMHFLFDSHILSMLNLLHGKIYPNSPSNRFALNICPQELLELQHFQLLSLSCIKSYQSFSVESKMKPKQIELKINEIVPVLSKT